MANWKNRIVGHGEEAPDQLLAHPRNWRSHPGFQQNALAAVLEDVGVVQNIIVNKRTGHLVDGHLRVMLAMRGEQPSIPVVYVDLTEEEESKILATLDPIGALAQTDQDKLDELLAGVNGSSNADLEKLLNKLKSKALAPTKEIKGNKEFKVKVGQTWACNDHRIICGDCLEVLKTYSVPDVILTDPPYGMNLDADWSGIRKTGPALGFASISGKKYPKITGDNKAFDPMPIFDLWGDEVKEVFLFGADYYADRIPNRLNGSWLVWDKRKDTQSEGFGSEFELIWSKNKHKRRVLRHDWFGFLSSDNTQEARNRDHPAQKPTSLMADILCQWSKSGDIVYDPFIGTGSTLLACEMHNRKCIGVEIEPEYVSLVLSKWQALTGKTPKLCQKPKRKSPKRRAKGVGTRAAKIARSSP